MIIKKKYYKLLIYMNNQIYTNTIDVYYKRIEQIIPHKFDLKTNILYQELLPVIDEIKSIEFTIKENINFYILKCNNFDRLIKAHKFLLLYILYSKKLPSKGVLGLDFEYNNYRELRKKYPEFKDKDYRETALFQICCYFDKEAFVVLLDPKDIKGVLYNIVVKLFICPAKKILHGGDGLDIPYLYKQFFKHKNDIKAFTRNLYDTKILCDYMNLLQNKKEKCNIYSFLLSEKIITKTKLEELLDNENKMGKIQYVYVDLYKIGDELLKYSIYDVIYLKELLIKILELNSLELDQVIDMTILTYLTRFNIVNLGKKIREGNHIVDKIDYLRKVYRLFIGSNNKYIARKYDLHSLLNLYIKD
jgi:hypothetical protein